MSEKEREYLRKTFPKMMEEMEESDKFQVDAIRTDSEEAKKATEKNLADSRTAVDFIRLCNRDKEALEIIDFLEKQSRISPEYAKRLRRQLTVRGLRSFGSKREPGFLE